MTLHLILCNAWLVLVLVLKVADLDLKYVFPESSIEMTATHLTGRIQKKKFNSEMFRGLQRLKLGMLSKFWSAKGGEVLENPLEKDFCFNLRLNFRRQRILTYVLRNHTDIRQTTNFTKNNLDSFKKQPNHLLFQVTLTRHNFNHAKQLLKSSFL